MYTQLAEQRKTWFSVGIFFVCKNFHSDWFTNALKKKKQGSQPIAYAVFGHTLETPIS